MTDPSVPDDWPPVWDALLRARETATLPPPAGPIGAGCAALQALYLPLIQARRDRAPKPRTVPQPPGAGPHPAPCWTVAQLGQSLDGCIATHTGDSCFVTGPASLLHLHRLRALSDAVLVGAGTVAADDPQLTTRRVSGPHPVRVVLDPTARLDGRARVFTDRQAPTLWLCDARHAAPARERLQGGAAEVVAVDGLLDPDDRVGPRPHRVLAALAARGLHVVFVEGGGVTVSRFMAAGALDRLHLIVAPLLIGEGRRAMHGRGPARLSDCRRPPAQRVVLGEDVLWDLDLAGA